MAMMNILMKEGKIQHVYGPIKRADMIKNGWRIVAYITGFNMSVTYNDRR